MQSIFSTNKYLSYSAAAQSVGLIRELILARYGNDELVSAWRSLNATISFSKFFLLGFNALPNYGKGLRQKYLLSFSISATLFSIYVIFAILVTILLFEKVNMLLVAMIPRAFVTFLSSKLQSEKKLSELGLLNFNTTLLTCIILVSIIYEPLNINYYIILYTCLLFILYFFKFNQLYFFVRLFVFNFTRITHIFCVSLKQVAFNLSVSTLILLNINGEIIFLDVMGLSDLIAEHNVYFVVTSMLSTIVGFLATRIYAPIRETFSSKDYAQRRTNLKTYFQIIIFALLASCMGIVLFKYVANEYLSLSQILLYSLISTKLGVSFAMTKVMQRHSKFFALTFSIILLNKFLVPTLIEPDQILVFWAFISFVQGVYCVWVLLR